MKSNSGKELSVLLGETAPTISDGVSTWEVDARPKRTSITRYTGRLPLKQDIVVMFDGYVDNASQEGRIRRLEDMAASPHWIKLSNVALRPDLKWVIEGIDWDTTNTIWMRTKGGAVRTRQQATIHFLEFIADDIIQTPSNIKLTSKQVKKPAKKIHLVTGLTLKQIAARELGNADKWHMLINANPWLPNDPRKLIRSGTVIVIPTSAWDAGLTNPIYMVP
jgi:hypothetical protein